MFRGAKLVRGFVKEKDDEQKLVDSATLAYKIERKSVLLRSIFMPSFRIVTLISMGIAIAYGSYLIIHQMDFTVGNLISFNIYLECFLLFISTRKSDYLYRSKWCFF